MCINCNIPLPVNVKIIEKYNLPYGCIMTNRELAEICNPRILGGGLTALLSGGVPDTYFAMGLDEINYTTFQNYDWILEKIIETKYGKIRCGIIIKKENDYILQNNETNLNILDKIYNKWYIDF